MDFSHYSSIKPLRLFDPLLPLIGYAVKHAYSKEQYPYALNAIIYKCDANTFHTVDDEAITLLNISATQ